MRKHLLIGRQQWLLFLILLVLLYCKTGQPVLAVGALVLLLLPFVSGIWNRVSRRNLQAAITLNTGAKKGEALSGSVSVTSGKLPCLGQIWYEVLGTNELTGEQVYQRGLVDGTGFEIPVPHCGRQLVQVTKLMMTDYLGVMAGTLPLEEQKRVTILPETFAVNVNTELLLSAAEDSEVYEANRRGYDPTEIFQLREYVPGDMVRGIHWKLSSKLDKLIFKEPALPVNRSLLLFWDQSQGSPRVLDTLGEAVFSLCQGLTEAGCVYTLGWMEQGHLRLEEVTCIDELLEKLPLLLRRKPGEVWETPDFSMFGKTMYFTGGLPEVTPGPDLQVLLCTDTPAGYEEEHILSFTPDNYKEKLDFSYER